MMFRKKFKALTMAIKPLRDLAPAYPICSPPAPVLLLPLLNRAKGLCVCCSFFWNALLPGSRMGILHLTQVPSGRPSVTAVAI